MATSMFSDFTSADRRKKAVTYGKASRLSTIPSSIPPTNEDVPLPEQARNLTAPLNASLKKVGSNTKPGRRVGGTPAGPGVLDIFDVPSDDEFSLHAVKPVKEFSTKHRIQKEDFEYLSSNHEPPTQHRKPGRTTQPLRKPEPTKSLASFEQKLPPARYSKAIRVLPQSSDDPIAPQIQDGKASQVVQKTTHVQKNRAAVQHPKAMENAPTRMKAPTLAAPKAQKLADVPVLPPARTASVTLAARKTPDLTVFDVPSSDEEAILPPRKPLRQVPVGKAIIPKKSAKAATTMPAMDTAESDDSSALRKRKRQGSMSSVSTIRPKVKHQREPSVSQRNRKYQKKEESLSAGHKSPDRSAAVRALNVQPVTSAINKPKRTRLRTVPVLARSTLVKGQASPAVLKSMLPARQKPKPSLVQESLEVAALEDDTMYEIPDPLATPFHERKTAVSGSVTPRQKALFGSLLGDSLSATTPMPRISALQLTNRNPTTLPGALPRSKSGFSHNVQSRHTKLIDKLKHTGTSSEDGDSSSDSEEVDEAPGISQRVRGHSSEAPQKVGHAVDVMSDDMDPNVEMAAESQASQASSGFGVRPRLTYAKSRSYLQEANFEDALQVSMDLDDDLGFESQKKDVLSEDEEDPTSQVRANHELKRRGQQTKFNDEARMLIDDISIKTSKSIRRSAMLELCNKMADTVFVTQLLDSSLAHQVFNDMTSNGEIIFDLATAVAVIFITRTSPTPTILEQIRHPYIVATLFKLADNNVEIRKLARDRKSNLSRIALESVEAFCQLVHESSIWSSRNPEKLSPQLLALKAVELLILGLRSVGNTEPLFDRALVSQLVGIATSAHQRSQFGKQSLADILILDMVLSILEAVSIIRQKQPVWSVQSLQDLAAVMPVFFQEDASTSSATLAMKLCMNLTNNKPKACQPFSGREFIQTLMSSVVHNFGLLHVGLEQEQQTEIVETLILSLGAMINLAEFSDEARLNVDDGKQMINSLVEIFLEGSERATQADSMEESHSGVAVGYLTVLLGNICLNSSIRSKVRVQLPGQQLNTLVDKIKEFVRFHEHVDSKAKHFEGAEGQETWLNYTARLLLVVEKLEKSER